VRRATRKSLYIWKVFEVCGQWDKGEYKATKQRARIEEKKTISSPRAVTKSQRMIDVQAVSRLIRFATS
jgi:hypothetical protein